MIHKLKIFCDFDGTITVNDVWLKIGDFFINDKNSWNSVISKFESMEIGARECFLKECTLIENIDRPKFDAIIDSIEIDSKFLNFSGFCKTNNIPLTILSEGMDYYIERVLMRFRLDIPFYANKLLFQSDTNSIGLDFPNADDECKRCGTCKRNILLNSTGDDEIAVYIGDGFSDTCVSKYADIVFAKGSLASYCWKNNITYFEYSDFGDITKKLEKILEKKHIKPRQNARSLRKDIYLRG